jgi:hypothetical protein
VNAVVAAVLLAAPQPGDYDPSTGKGPEWGKAAPIGLLVILLLAIAMLFLLRSFTRQLKKVPATFDPVEPAVQVDPGSRQSTADPSGDAARVPAAADDGPRPDARRPAGPDDSPG